MTHIETDMPQWLHIPAPRPVRDTESSKFATMGRREDASSYSDHLGQPPDLSGAPQPNLNQHGDNENRQQQGGYGYYEDQARTNIYAAVDGWRSYSNGSGSLAAVNPHHAAPTYGLNPGALTFQPGAHTASTRSRTQSTPFQPLRFSSGVNEKQIVKGLSQPQRTVSQAEGTTNAPEGHLQSQLPLRTHNYPLRSKQPSREFSSNRPVQSVETPTKIDPAGAQAEIEARRRPRRQHTPQHTVSPPPPPDATKAYIDQARLPIGLRTDKPQPLLVILDLNGTLIVKPNSTAPTKFRMRPGVAQLFDYLFAKHVVMIYTSSRPHNAKAVVEKLFSSYQRRQLAAVWARDKLGLNRTQYNEKVQVYKKLDKIWRDKYIQAKCPDGGRWDQTNTILVDDSHLKALAQPYNLLQIPEFAVFPQHKSSRAAIEKYKSEQEEIVNCLVVKLEELRWQVDVSRLIFRWQTGKLKAPEVPRSGVVDEGKVDQKEIAEAEAQAQRHTATPRSSDSDGGVKLADLSDDVEVIDLVSSDDDLSVDGYPDILKETGSLSMNSTQKRSESPVPATVWSELLGDEGEDAELDIRKSQRGER